MRTLVLLGNRLVRVGYRGQLVPGPSRLVAEGRVEGF